jgi:hypothetical protein
MKPYNFVTYRDGQFGITYIKTGDEFYHEIKDLETPTNAIFTPPPDKYHKIDINVLQKFFHKDFFISSMSNQYITQDILENWESYIQNTIRTGIELNWGDRTKELIKIYKKYAI